MFLHNSKERKLEWWLAISTTIIGLLVLWPTTDSFNKVFHQPVLSVMPEWVWGLSFTVVGMWHVVALQINGRASWTPILRAIAAVFTAMVFSMLGWSFSIINQFSVSSVTFGILIPAAAIVCGYQAGKDIAKEVSFIKAGL